MLPECHQRLLLCSLLTAKRNDVRSPVSGTLMLTKMTGGDCMECCMAQLLVLCLSVAHMQRSQLSNIVMPLICTLVSVGGANSRDCWVLGHH